MLQHWFPRLEFQQECINNIVTSGPYIPKLDNQKNSTWELHSTYTFYFKWGGAELPEQETANPRTQGQYEVPDKLQQQQLKHNLLTIISDLKKKQKMIQLQTGFLD